LILNKARRNINISIKDNGIGREKSFQKNKNKLLEKKSIGIKLTKERLKNFFKDYQNPYELNFIDLFDDDNYSKGTEVILKIPTV